MWYSKTSEEDEVNFYGLFAWNFYWIRNNTARSHLQSFMHFSYLINPSKKLITEASGK